MELTFDKTNVDLIVLRKGLRLIERKRVYFRSNGRFFPLYLGPTLLLKRKLVDLDFFLGGSF